MSKLYRVNVDGTVYRILSGNVGQAIKNAVGKHLDGRSEPEGITIKVVASVVPPIEVERQEAGAAKAG